MNDFKQVIRFGNQHGTQLSRAINFVMNLVTDKDHEWEVTVKPYKESKTGLQLGYYWGVIIPAFVRHTGHTKDEADQFLKEQLLLPTVKSILGKVVEVRPSIAKMKVGEMAAYIDLCIIWMATNDMAVPPPTYKAQEYA